MSRPIQLFRWMYRYHRFVEMSLYLLTLHHLRSEQYAVRLRIQIRPDFVNAYEMHLQFNENIFIMNVHV